MNLPARMDALTGLRAFAAAAVVGFHFGGTALAPDDVARSVPVVKSLYLGVDLFFLLSGFVLMHAHGEEFAAIRAATVRRFYGLRLARIYPVHAAILLLLAAGVAAQSVLSPATGFAVKSADRFPLDGLLKHLLLVGWSSPTWNPPAWSLSAEWAAYLVFPLLACLIARLSLLACGAVLAACLVSFGALYAEAFGYVLDRHGLERVVIEFPMGCLLYRLATRLPPRTQSWAPPSALLAFAGVAIALFGTRWGDFAVVPALGALILTCASRNLVSRALSVRWMVWLGEVSYALYMVHVLVLGMLARLVLRLAPGLTWPVLLPLALSVAVACAAALHYTVERPARERLRQWLRPPRDSAPSVGKVLATVAPRP